MPQKIKALKYLATIGCACHPGVKDALLAALDDCTEAVRYEGALAFCHAAGNYCEVCHKTSCCGPDVRRSFATWLKAWIATGAPRNRRRVRQAAAGAFNACNMVTPEEPASPGAGPGEDPDAGRAALPSAARSGAAAACSLAWTTPDTVPLRRMGGKPVRPSPATKRRSRYGRSAWSRRFPATRPLQRRPPASLKSAATGLMIGWPRCRAVIFLGVRVVLALFPALKPRVWPPPAPPAWHTARAGPRSRARRAARSRRQLLGEFLRHGRVPAIGDSQHDR